MESTIRLHPGLDIALRRFDMTETDVAKAIAGGELASPQQFLNSWYFSLRITGTKTAFRSALDEYVFRRPANYLNEEFLERCNGLPVIIEHPTKQMLDTQQFAERIIGTIVLPFIGTEGIIDSAGDEVWGIARVLDQDAAKFMCEHQLSTSPAVAQLDPETTTKIELTNGKHLLIEGAAKLLDHLAICSNGVWDKGLGPTGVEAGITDSDGSASAGVESAGLNTGNPGERVMADENKKVEEENRVDAEAGKKLDKLLAGLDSMHARMDAIEESQREERERQDAARRDAEEAEEEERQAAELEAIAAEEREEAGEALARGDKAERTHWLSRKDDESATEHSNRVHAFAAKHDASTFCRKDGETHMEHSARCDGLGKKFIGGRRDADEGEKMPPDIAAKIEEKKDVEGSEGEGGEKEAKEETREMEKTEEAESARKDAEIARIKADAEKVANELADLKRKVEMRPDDEEAAFADAQARADEVFLALGERAPRPLPGEQLISYRTRMARKLQAHSSLKDVDLGVIARADAPGFAVLETRVYADAMAAARNPTDVPLGNLREVRRRRAGGGEIIEFVGNPLSCWASFMRPEQYLTNWNPPSNRGGR